MVRATDDDTRNRTVNNNGILQWDSNTVQRAVRMREQGYTYRQIDTELGTATGTAWRLVNREQYRDAVNDSRKRWTERGCTSLWQGDE